ncbi:hypothetical protein ACFLZB_04620 [Nanoarchaeota archaeon]
MFFQEVFRKVTQAIKKHKWLFLSIFIVQIVFLVVLAVINVKYQLAMVESLKNVVMTLETANYNESMIQMGTPFLENPEMIYTSYEAIWSNLKALLGFSFVAFLIFECFIWAVSSYMLRKQNFIQLYVKYIAVSLVYLVPAFFVIYLILKSFWESAFITLSTDVSIFILVIISYFMMITFSLLHKKAKDIIQLTFKIGITKIDYIAFTFMICLVVLGFFGLLMYVSTAWSFLVMILLIVLFILAMIVLRIFVMAAISELS